MGKKLQRRTHGLLRHVGDLDLVRRIADLLPASRKAVHWPTEPAATWYPGVLHGSLQTYACRDPIRLEDLVGMDAQKYRLERNTKQFLCGLPANNALLWGARGTGKSSLVHALLNRYAQRGLRLIQVDKHSLGALPDIVGQIRQQPYKYLICSDDLSFEAEDATYKTLKSVLEGSVFSVAENVLIYATSNRRHLLPEQIGDNQDVRMVAGELHPGEAIEEKISLSDRFGIWLSFYPFSQETYLEAAQHWVRVLASSHQVGLPWNTEARAEALRWALARGIRSGRTANYFARDWVGQALLHSKEEPGS